ncbi:unnamed protein product [Urochloa decumbens]|uniref:DUF7378 domain-containing protein n=1 Tax=Urochloa decumbens TaxID=240449 RepID=A0ABC9HCL8_9POAL
MPPPAPPLPYARTAEEVNSRAAGIPRAFRRLMLWAPPSPTVGEETKLERPALWVPAVLLPCVVLGISAALTVFFYTDMPDLAASAPWRGPAVMLGGVFPAVVMVVVGYMHLFLPRAPLALRDALVDVGLGCIGVPLWCAGALVACFGSAWVFIAMACLVAILVAGVLAFWVCLDRVYG